MGREQVAAAVAVPAWGHAADRAPIVTHSTLVSRWRRYVAVVALGLTDWLVVVGCCAFVWSLRATTMRAFWPELGAIYPFQAYVTNLYWFAPWMLAFAEAGLYTRRALFWDELWQVIRACTMAALFAVFLSYAVRSDEELSRLIIAGVWALSMLMVPIARAGTKQMLARLGIWQQRVLVVGTGDAARETLARLRDNPLLGYEPVVCLDDDPRTIGRTAFGLPVCGPLATLPWVVRDHGVQTVMVAMPSLSRTQLLHLTSTCQGHVDSIHIVPDLSGLASLNVETEDLDGMLTLRMRFNLARPWNRALKRSVDLLLAIVLAAALLPLLLLIALAVRLDSPGPALFVQQRLGPHGRLFRFYKFRTMFLDNQERLQTRLAHDPAARAEWQRYAKLKSDDPRVTRVGRLLRRTSFDELPQLAHVIAGDMRLVGPRPYLPSERQQMGDFAHTILKTPPGMTGLWQVSGRNEVPFDERLRLDEYYVRNWCLWMDVVVLLRTFRVVLRRQGAY